MNSKKHETLQLSWDYVSEHMTMAISSIIGKHIQCKVKVDDSDYWTIKFVGYQMPIEELCLLFEMVKADENTQRRTLPTDRRRYVRDINMDLANEILSATLQCRWKWQLASDDLWLVGVTYDDTRMELCGVEYDMHSLKSKQDLLDYLNENGATHSSLMDFCEDYRNQYHNELCWAYPISDGLHLGTYFVLVREGIVCLPYDSANEEDYELFRLEDIKQLDVDSLKNLIRDWQSYSKELWQAMHGMLWYLKKQEVHNNGKN